MTKPKLEMKLRKMTQDELKHFAKKLKCSVDDLLFHTGGMVAAGKSIGNWGEKNGMYGRNRSGKNNPRFGVTVSQETRDKISKANTGKRPSPEIRKSMSISQKKRWTKELREWRSQLSKSRGIIPPSSKGMLWWTDGKIAKRSKTCPGDNFKPGRPPKIA